MIKKAFRDDINGLRAWAVISVILFHFGVPGFSGGFVGVDIFFVISGFLMTGIIYKGLNKESFTLLDFYLARAKRIIPALVTLCLTLIALGWAFLPAIEFEQLGKHSAGAVTFLSNMVFWKESGYFDSESHDKWLLHTWSLSVEWQFYILLPLIIIVLWKVRPQKNTLIVIFTLGIIVSLVLSIIITELKPRAAFYLLPTRAWEMLAGGLVFLLQNYVTRNKSQLKLLELIGFFLIIFSIFYFDDQTSWPGWKALLPVLGTCLVIISNQRESPLSTTKLHSVFGKWSYSLYLWHWPLVVFLNYISEQSNPYLISIGLLITIISGFLSYKFIESPASDFLNSKKQHFALLMSILTITVPLILGVYITSQSGVHGRIPSKIDAIFDMQKDINPRKNECFGTNIFHPAECTYGGPDLAVIVLGDSHAAGIVKAVERSLPSKDKHVLDWTISGCPTVIGLNREGYPACYTFNKYALKKQKNIDYNIPILIFNRNALPFFGPNENKRQSRYYFNKNTSTSYEKQLVSSYIDTLCSYAKSRPVFVMRPTPEFKINVPKKIGRSILLGGGSKFGITKQEYFNRQQVTWDAQDTAHEKCGIYILDPLPYICKGNNCQGSKKGIPIYYDDDHLNLYGADQLIPLFKSIFEVNNKLAID
ncbi:MAG: peptidoglycan/LPS O-acetylase OafA/YrhL [Paraglaciecola sp.]|jgi:peptidoglycan/LPS O-acetylase OafA/YrhL